MQSYISSVPEKVDLKDKPTLQKEFKVDRVELSDNIQKFDQRKRVPNPYDYNSISLKKHNKPELTNKSLDQIITDPLYSGAARVLGVNNAHDWEKDYDKIQFITDWAKEKTKISDNQRLIDWIYDIAGKATTISNRRLDDLFVYAKMNGRGFTPLTKTKVIEKIVKVKSKQDNTQKEVDNFMKGILNVA